MNFANNTGYISTFNRKARNTAYYDFVHEECRNYFGRVIGNLTTLARIMGLDLTAVLRYSRSHGVYFSVTKHRYIAEVLHGRAKSPHLFWLVMISGGLGLGLEVLMLPCDEFEERIRGLIVERGDKEWLFPHNMGVGLVRMFAYGRLRGVRSVEVLRAGVVVVDLTPSEYYRRHVRSGRVEDAEFIGRGKNGSKVLQSGMNGRGEWVLLVGWTNAECLRRVANGLYVPSEEDKAMHQRLFEERMQEGWEDEVDIVEVEEAKKWGVRRYEGLKRSDNGKWRGYIGAEVGIGSYNTVLGDKEAELVRKRDMKRVRAMVDGDVVVGQAVKGVKEKTEERLRKVQERMAGAKDVEVVISAPKRKRDVAVEKLEREQERMRKEAERRGFGVGEKSGTNGSQDLAGSEDWSDMLPDFGE